MSSCFNNLVDCIHEFPRKFKHLPEVMCLWYATTHKGNRPDFSREHASIGTNRKFPFVAWLDRPSQGKASPTIFFTSGCVNQLTLTSHSSFLFNPNTWLSNPSVSVLHSYCLLVILPRSLLVWFCYAHLNSSPGWLCAFDFVFRYTNSCFLH